MLSERSNLFSKIYMWLFLGLVITFSVAYTIHLNEPLLNTLFKSGNYLIIVVIQIVAALVLSFGLHKMNPVVAGVLYILYTALTGLTFSTLFIVYNLTSIIYIFAIAAVIFLVFSLLGYFTKLDLSKISTFLFMALLGIILLSIVSIFVKSVALNLGLTIGSMIIFIIYTAYDMHMIKRNLYRINNESSLAIYGAFQLYLDFVNIFLDLLRIFGKEK